MQTSCCAVAGGRQSVGTGCGHDCKTFTTCLQKALHLRSNPSAKQTLKLTQCGTLCIAEGETSQSLLRQLRGSSGSSSQRLAKCWAAGGSYEKRAQSEFCCAEIILTSFPGVKTTPRSSKTTSNSIWMAFQRAPHGRTKSGSAAIEC